MIYDEVTGFKEFAILFKLAALLKAYYAKLYDLLLSGTPPPAAASICYEC